MTLTLFADASSPFAMKRTIQNLRQQADFDEWAASMLDTGAGREELLELAKSYRAQAVELAKKLKRSEAKRRQQAEAYLKRKRQKITGPLEA